ncbi:hypothetical protein HAHE_15270 [Haloferula helveola]|uniref:Uncharacterized protein n=1 Tax=Haloferula helveola TaxID=490095 RepID=A0ABM7R900_9BACT|nr:hypothetical protein HAHE_15270 [Haloferula helveola]
MIRIVPLLLATAGLAGATTGTIVSGSTTLNIVPQAGATTAEDKNIINIKVQPGGNASWRTEQNTSLTGTVDVEVEIDITNDRAISFSLIDGRASATDMRFRVVKTQTSQLGYDLRFENLSCGIFTTAPPALITDPVTGEFDAADHTFLIDQGTATGYFWPPFSNKTNVAENFAPPNQIAGAGAGTGTITLVPTGSANGFTSYDIVASFPIAIDQTDDSGDTTVRTIASGTIQATGSITVADSPFVAWTNAEGIPGALPGDDFNGDGLPNAFAWAYGLGAYDDYPDSLPRSTAAGGFELPLPPFGTAAPILIEVSTTLGVWTPLPAGRCSAGVNPLPIGTTGTVTVTPSGQACEFLRLQVNE